MTSSDDLQRLHDDIERVADYVSLNEKRLLTSTVPAMVTFLQILSEAEGNACSIEHIRNVLQALERVNVSDVVRFDLKISAKAEPSVTNDSVSEDAARENPVIANFTDAAGDTRQFYSGLIKSMSSDYGFISCDNIKCHYGRDAFFPAWAAPLGCKVGDTIDFELIITLKGQPQAKNLRLQSGAAITVDDCELIFPDVANSTIKPRRINSDVNTIGFSSDSSFSDTKSTEPKFFGVVKAIIGKFGFIACKEIMIQYGNDVFFPVSALPDGCSNGDTVEFGLRVKNGNPQAINLRWCDKVYTPTTPACGTPMGQLWHQQHTRPRAMALSAPDKVKDTAIPTGETHYGTITAKTDIYGFIACHAVKQVYGQDVFFASNLAIGFNAGEHVIFDLLYNQGGQLQASNLRRADVSNSKAIHKVMASSGMKRASDLSVTQGHLNQRTQPAKTLKKVRDAPSVGAGAIPSQKL